MRTDGRDGVNLDFTDLIFLKHSDAARMALAVRCAEVCRFPADSRSGGIENRHFARNGRTFPVVWRRVHPFQRPLPQCNHADVLDAQNRSASLVDGSWTGFWLHSIQVGIQLHRPILRASPATPSGILAAFGSFSLGVNTVIMTISPITARPLLIGQ